jgi:hypothetical protein
MSRDRAKGDPASPSSLNGYNYGDLNPILMLDPSGLAATTGAAEGGGCDWLCIERDRLLNAPVSNQNPDPCFDATGPCTYTSPEDRPAPLRFETVLTISPAASSVLSE